MNHIRRWKIINSIVYDSHVRKLTEVFPACARVTSEEVTVYELRKDERCNNRWYWLVNYIDLWQQHIFVRAKLSWDGILYWGEKQCCFIQRELSNSGSDKELCPFSILTSVMLLKQSDFFLHFVIWCSRCCESWVWHPSRWARHSE